MVFPETLGNIRAIINWPWSHIGRPLKTMTWDVLEMTRFVIYNVSLTSAAADESWIATVEKLVAIWDVSWATAVENLG